ncbi:unnamed protein product [Dracunculus medinensis]|uniref:30S ribosomal protein S21 n=1 Tax=Dracunculus medinensis TaxID=318479 RepID=A0A0N4UH37_DRAME|nr:unnamed protein product [Dracunculus medinensis]
MDEKFKKRKEVSDENIQNFYVDNIIVAAKDTEKALRKYKAIKKLFGGIKMIIRSFVSNDKQLAKKTEAIKPNQLKC